MTTIDTLFQSVEKLLCKQAWTASNRYGIPFDAALSECHQVFMKATEQFQEGRGTKFSTFLQLKLQWHFLTLARKHIQRATRFAEMELNEEVVGAAPEQHKPALEAVDGMSSEAQEIIEMLLETPAELLGVWDPVRPKQLLARVKLYLRSKHGYSKRRLEEAHKEIQTTFRAIWATT
jgi:hypothetical protein